MYDTGLLTYSLRCELRDEALSTEIIRDDGSLDIKLPWSVNPASNNLPIKFLAVCDVFEHAFSYGLR